MNPCRGMELQLLAGTISRTPPALVTFGKGQPVPFRYEAWWAPDLDWTIWKNFPPSCVAWSLDAAERVKKKTFVQYRKLTWKNDIYDRFSSFKNTVLGSVAIEK